MYCEQCGAQNSDTAKFCRKCGADLAAEEETRVVRKQGTEAASGRGERQVFSITPTMKFVAAAYALTAVAAILLVALIAILLPTIVPLSIAVAVGLLLFAIPLFYHIKQKLLRYTLTDSNLEIDAGLISRTTRAVPLRRIQDVTVSATIPQRLLGLGNVVIDNASEDAGKVVLANIDSPRRYADMLLDQMRQLER